MEENFEYIVRKYYNRLREPFLRKLTRQYPSMRLDIAEETGLKNAQTAKAKKSQCMTDLINRVTEALRRAGFDVIPKKRNRNGMN